MPPLPPPRLTYIGLLLFVGVTENRRWSHYFHRPWEVLHRAPEPRGSGPYFVVL